MPYNPLRDVKEVVSGLAVDINEMLATGIVKDSSATLDNNQIDDPSQIIGLVRDEFAAIDAMRAIRKFGKRNKDSRDSKQAQQAAQAASEVGAPAPTNSSAE